MWLYERETTKDHTLPIRQIMGKYYEHDKNLHMIFVYSLIRPTLVWTDNNYGQSQEFGNIRKASENDWIMKLEHLLQSSIPSKAI